MEQRALEGLVSPDSSRLGRYMGQFSARSPRAVQPSSPVGKRSRPARSGTKRPASALLQPQPKRGEMTRRQAQSCAGRNTISSLRFNRMPIELCPSRSCNRLGCMQSPRQSGQRLARSQRGLARPCQGCLTREVHRQKQGGQQRDWGSPPKSIVPDSRRRLVHPSCCPLCTLRSPPRSVRLRRRARSGREAGFPYWQAP